MRTTLFFIFALLLTSPLHALLVDTSGNAIEVTYRDSYYFFSRCRFDAQATAAQRLSDCQLLNADNGLRQQDFELLHQRLQAKAERVERSAARLQQIKWGLIALTSLSVLLTVRKLHKEKVLQMLGGACCDGHHHHHGLWKRISAHFPRFDVAGGGRFFFREQQWRMPTLLAQVLAIVATGQKSRANLDKKMVYEFLQTEILQLSAVQDSALVINVRSITAIEFMLYEIMRLRQAELEEQTADR